MPGFNRVPVGIAGIGASIPNRVMTNYDLEKLVDTSDEWIRSRTGIVERRMAEKGQNTSDLAVEAAKNALADAGVGAEEVDLIIVATVTPDYSFPSTACLVQKRLGAVKAASFDLAAGCSGFVYGLVTGAQYIASGQYETVLVIGAEVLSKIVNWQDRNTCVLFGDGAGAAVLRPTQKGYGLLSFQLGSDGSGGGLLMMGPDGYLKMNGREVFKFAVKIMGDAALEVIERAGLTPADIDFFIPHQANLRIIEAAAKRLAMPMDKVYVNVDRYGNTSAASIPVALYEARERGLIKSGDNLALVGFGAGLTWAAAVIRWSI
ncbi:3-oxoacyl-(acyl-carrier-protein) synthase III [Thermincola ferriacetica]|uniref:Beta-ketoacyl-[acyl-carrier-protein] synthase III n=1 Tax=Thermincola ferriacetica TaxID=281456 RepID=A0A0L6W3D6_9FIRM|nr:beta-ketoacyl-ACP synthase III [Thermincola ferriacetica]KNZ69599.1 3-oxoacyl-(acyl-carrier-protein) synthase III [Thermincola ferriacetica]